MLNATVSSLGSEEFTFLTGLPSSEIAMDDKAYSLLMRLKSNKLSLQHGSVISIRQTLLGICNHNNQMRAVEWSWLAGDINYDDAKVSIKVTSLTLFKGTQSLDLKVFDQ